MKQLDIDTLVAKMDEEDWGSFHDSVYGALYLLGLAPVNACFDQDMLTEVLRRLPEHICSAALSWGFGDTVVRDNVVRYVRDKVRVLGSFDAFLDAAPE